MRTETTYTYDHRRGVFVAERRGIEPTAPATGTELVLAGIVGWAAGLLAVLAAAIVLAVLWVAGAAADWLLGLWVRFGLLELAFLVAAAGLIVLVAAAIFRPSIVRRSR